MLIAEFFLNFVLALCGGLLMNFMPCILPLISLKISTFIKNSSSKRDFVLSNVLYSLGIFAFFSILGIFVVFSKSVAGSVMLIGHMQSGIFLLVVFFILLLVALNLSGFFEFNFGVGSSRISNILSHCHGKISYFFNGFFISILSISCTAPFIVTALTYAMKSNTNLVITMLGISFGFSAPFLLAAIFSNKVLNVIPRSGPWMSKFKSVMSFPIYGAVLWILYVLIKQNNIFYVSIAISFGFVLFFIGWFIKNFDISFRKKLIFCSIALFLAYIMLPNNIESVVKEDFSLQKLNTSLQSHQKVLVVASASWCVTCYFNEKNALESKEFFDLLAERGVRYLYLDLTNHNDEGENFLMYYRHSGVPFYILFSSNGDYEILPQTLTKSFVLKKIYNLS
jgi:thiol:disulfide interchange protein